MRVGAVLLIALAATAGWLGPIFAGGSGAFGYAYVSDRQHGFWSGPGLHLAFVPPYVPLKAGDRVTVLIDAVLDQGSARIWAWRRSDLTLRDVAMGHLETVGEVVASGRSSLVYTVPRDGFYSFTTELGVGRLKEECRRRWKENPDLLRHIAVTDWECPTRAGSYSASFRVDRKA